MDKGTSEPDVYTVTEAAEKLGVNASHLYALIRRGEFPVPVITIGRRKVISRRRFDSFLHGGEAA